VETAAAAVAGGVVGFVLKPFHSADFLLTTRRALDQVLASRERKRLLERLEQSERRHREVVEGIPAPVLALDAEGAIIVFNRHLEKLSGFERREMLGRPGRELIGEGGDRRLQTKGGEARIIRWQCADIATPSGTTTYAMGIDVTDEREMLRRTVRAERLAAVGTLAAGLAHEVRNPLNSANLQLQVLKRRLAKGQSAGVAQSADLVAGEIERLDRLVSEFLAFARPQPLALVAVDPNRFVASVHAQLRPEAEAKGVRLTFSGAPHVENADIEEERMRQVLLNLTRNALEAVGQGGSVELRTRAADARGNLTIEVEDDGPGFSEDAPIFDAFYTTKEHGTGLGLAIAHRIVTDHGGTLSVSSQPKATCFSVVLPQRTRHASDAP
jgi:signal transduction histidine kinase